MVIVHIEHEIDDFDTWLTSFERFAETRHRAGVRRHRVRRPVDDPAYVLIELELDEEAGARAFEGFLRTTVWTRPENSPALAGVPVTRILREEDVPG